MLKFEKRATTSTTLKTLGTVSQFVGVGGKFKPASERNLADASKRVSVLLINAEGESVLVNCSKPVSADLRSKKLPWADLAGLSILELPQFDSNGEPVMTLDETTGEEIPLVLHSISYNGASSTDALAVEITQQHVDATVSAVREVDWSQYVAL